MPQSISDWVSFFRWLFSLYSTASNSTSAAQSITISPKPNRVSDQETIGAVEGLLNARQAPAESRQLDVAAIEAIGRPPHPSAQPDSSCIFLLGKTPYPPPKTAILIEDTHTHRANYPANSYVDGTMYYETDRTVYYIVQAGSWVYMQGVMSGTLSPDTKPVGLALADAGFRFDATDFYHEYVWNGTVWHYAPWDLGSGWMIMGGQPNPAIFSLCNGSVATLSLDNGTTTTFLTPNTASDDPFLQCGPFTAAPYLATAPTWDSSAKSDPGTAHHHAPGTLATGANGSMSSPGTTGPSIQVAADGHTHFVTSGTTADESTHYHPLTNGNAKLNPPSVANNGLPKRIQVSLYVRI